MLIVMLLDVAQERFRISHMLKLLLKMHPSNFNWVDLNTHIYMKTLINAPTKLNNPFLLEQQFEIYKIICINIPK